MTVDVRRSLIDYLWGRLTTDPTMKERMGADFRCYWPMAEEDASFPYLAHRLSISAEPGTHVIQGATYYLDIWSHSTKGEEITSIRERIIQLLDQLDFSTDDVGVAHMELLSDDDAVSGERGIWHFAMIFEMIFRRDSEAASIDGREIR